MIQFALLLTSGCRTTTSWQAIKCSSVRIKSLSMGYYMMSRSTQRPEQISGLILRLSFCWKFLAGKCGSTKPRDQFPFFWLLHYFPCPTMTSTSADNSLSIFKDGRLKPGSYKIQNIFAETYLDFEVHSRELCCRRATDLGEGNGIVRRYPLPVIRI